MVTPSVGTVVLVQFPFSDLSDVKLRPAVVVADAGRGDWILCQITSKPYSDPAAVEITDSDFDSGSLQVASYVRPGKVFCANQRIMTSSPGTLNPDAAARVIEALIGLLRASLVLKQDCTP
jgi:mRNA interferase MazF